MSIMWNLKTKDAEKFARIDQNSLAENLRNQKDSGD